MYSGRLKLSDDDDDDDELFSNAIHHKTNMSNIFGIPFNHPTTGQGSNTENSFKYVPPKPSRLESTTSRTEKLLASTSSPNSSNSSEWSICKAKVVTAFKLLNNQNVSQGKIGFALLANTQGKYRIILYRSKTNILSTTSLEKDTKLLLKDPYIQIYDDTKSFWSILLDPEDRHEFIEEFKKCDAMIEIVSGVSDRMKQDEQERSKSSQDEIKSSGEERLEETKATILSRMAKMGQPLPKIANKPDIISDSSDPEIGAIENKTPAVKASVISRKPRSHLIPSNTSISSTAMTAVPHGQQISTTYHHDLNSQQQAIMNVLLADNRTQNTEVRMGLSKIETKIEKVLDKIESLENQTVRQRNSRDQEDVILEFEEKILKVKKENRLLKQKSAALEADLQKFRVENSENPKVDLKEFEDLIEKFNIDTTNSEPFNILQLLVNKLEEELRQNTEKLQSSEKINEISKTETEQTYEKLSNYQKENSQLKTEFDSLNSQIKTLQSEKDALRQEIDSINVQNKTNVSATVVKSVMNNLYEILVDNLDAFPQDNIPKSHILKICATAIKEETKKAFKGES